MVVTSWLDRWYKKYLISIALLIVWSHGSNTISHYMHDAITQVRNIEIEPLTNITLCKLTVHRSLTYVDFPNGITSIDLIFSIFFSSLVNFSCIINANMVLYVLRFTYMVQYIFYIFLASNHKIPLSIGRCTFTLMVWMKICFA